MGPVPGLLWRSRRIFQIWGSDRHDTKHVIAAILCAAARHRWQHEQVTFLRPAAATQADKPTSISRRRRSHVQLAKPYVNFSRHHQTFDHRRTFDHVQLHVGPTFDAYGFFALEKGFFSLAEKLLPINNNPELLQFTESSRSPLSGLYDHILSLSKTPGWVFYKTNGGIRAPIRKISQADFYRPLRVPALLVGELSSNGTSAIISAYESLRIRGYDIESVFLLGRKGGNLDYLERYFHELNTRRTAIPAPPRLIGENWEETSRYIENASQSQPIQDLLKDLAQKHDKRIANLESMANNAHSTVWYPSAQRKPLSPKDITTIDSAYGDYFQTPSKAPNQEKGYTEAPALLRPTFDGSASWWTQGLGHGNLQQTLSAAYAAGRYGNFMFRNSIHEPAIELARILLKHSENPRSSRVFFADNSSTAIEVALKMALHTTRTRYGWSENDKDIGVLGLCGSSHADMDPSKPSILNNQLEWKRFRFNFPTVKMIDGSWVVDTPRGYGKVLGDRESFDSLADVFDGARYNNHRRGCYEAYILGTLKRLYEEGRKFGALVIEPVVLGSGGILFCDPLFQNTLVKVVRKNPHLFSETTHSPVLEDEHDWTGLPVIFDEAFTGLYRLGHFTSASLLTVHPDVTANAKLPTGGLLPLSTTMASRSIFDAFKIDKKTDSLLHGHSYTAHAIGCQVALDNIKRLRQKSHKQVFDFAWMKEPFGEMTLRYKGKVWSVWSPKFVKKISKQTEKVEWVWALGSVLAINIKDEASDAGYAARALQTELLVGKSTIWSIHARVSGNVLYLMASKTSTPDAVRDLEECLLRADALQ